MVTDVDAQRAHVDCSLGRELRALGEEHWGPVLQHLDELGAALIERYEARVDHPIKIDLLDQVVSIIRRNRRPDERVREISNLIRGWQQMPQPRR